MLELNLPFSQINVWLDIIFFAVIAIILVVFLGVHLPINFLTGRAKARFVEWKWPHAHDAPFAPRFMHLVHVFGMITLGTTGLLIRFPSGPNPITAKFIHYGVMFIVTTNFFARIWYAMFSKNRDYKDFVMYKKDLRVLIPCVLYYTFFKPSYKHVSKYGPMQKMTYWILFPLSMFIMIFSGFYLFFSYQLGQISPIFTLGLGVATARTLVRLVHYVFNWFLIIFTTIHVYLSVTEDYPAFLYFFFGYRAPRTLEQMALDAHGGHGEAKREDEKIPEPAVIAIAEEIPPIQPEISTYRKGGRKKQPEPEPEPEPAMEGEAQQAFTGLVDSLQTLSERLAMLEDKLSHEKKEEE